MNYPERENCGAPADVGVNEDETCFGCGEPRCVHANCCCHCENHGLAFVECGKCACCVVETDEDMEAWAREHLLSTVAHLPGTGMKHPEACLRCEMAADLLDSLGK